MISAKLGVFVTFLWLSLSPEGRGESPRNVLFIAIDDLNDYVGCLGGHPNALTPNIDRLAKRGTLFTNAHCQAPICGPSRASLMTGLRPSTTGIYGQISDKKIRGASAATEKAIFLPDYLESKGYQTLGCGKIYHNGDGAKTFDTFGHGTNFGPKPKKRFNYDPAWYEDRIGGTQTDWGAYPERDEEMPDFKTAGWVVDKIGELSKAGGKRKPFFLAAGFCRPHVPWYVPEKWMEMHPIDEIKMPPYKADDWDDLPEISKRVNVAPMMPAMDWVLSNDHWQAMIQSYLASTTFADHQVGKLLDALDLSPFAKDTFIILWSDHGYHMGEKGRFAKQSLWEMSSHVPLIVAGAGLPEGKTCDAPVELLDLYPTVVDLLGLPENPGNEGHSLVPLLKDPEADWKDAAITTYGPNNHAVRTRTHRLIHYEDGSAELYDHRNDPDEWDNIAENPDGRNVIEELKRFLPARNAPNAKGSAYDFNAYFKEVLK